MKTKRRRPPAPPAEPQPPAVPYTPTAKEKAVLDTWGERRRTTPRAPKLRNRVVDGINKLDVDHPDQGTGFALLMEALGTVDENITSALVDQLARVMSKKGTVDAMGVNFALAVIAGVQPRDHLETLLAAQMAAVHEATMSAAARLAHAEHLPQHDSAERTFNKLARTFAVQLETLKRYRTGGEQRVTVQHVNVGEGGQAIVGNVNAAGGTQGGPGALPNVKATP
jgi:hypothetical protein